MWWWMIGCPAADKTPPTDSTPNLDGDADTDTDTDADADVDTDTPTDSGGSGTHSGTTPTGPTADTGALEWNGTYLGSITGQMTSQQTPSGPLRLTDCTGAVTIVVDGSAADVISGTGTCADAYGYTSWNVAIDGDLTTDPMASGGTAWTLGLFPFNQVWNGGFAVDTLLGHGQGSTGGGYPQATWTFDFTASR